MHLKSGLFALSMLTALAGCGGGGSSSAGGGQNPSPGNSGNDWLQFTPSAITLTATEGRALDFSVVAKSSKTIAQNFNVGIIDPSGIVTTQVKISAITPTEYRVAMTVSDKLSSGPHSGKLEVRLCEDEPLTCAKPIQGSPWFVPISVTVKSATNLTALSAQPGLGRWTTLGGANSNIGYVPLRLDPAKFTQRWASSYLPAGVQLGATMPVVEDGVAFIVIIKDGYNSNYLRAIEEASGKVLWETKVPNSVCRVTPAALADGKVFVGAGTCAFLNDQLVAFDQKTGQLLYSVPGGDISAVAAPQANSNELYTRGRSDIGSGYFVTKINPANGATIWRKGYDNVQTIGADAQSLYVIDSKNLTILNQSTGTAAAQASPSTSCYSGYALPVLGAAGQMYISCAIGGGISQLLAYDSSAKKTTWSAPIAAVNSVLAGSTLYSINGSTVEARNAADGKTLWSVNPQSASGLTLGALVSLVATDNLLFVSGDQGVVAIDLATQKAVWSFPQGGPMAISAKGVLYLPGHVGTYITESTFPALVAVNLL